MSNPWKSANHHHIRGLREGTSLPLKLWDCPTSVSLPACPTFMSGLHLKNHGTTCWKAAYHAAYLSVNFWCIYHHHLITWGIFLDHQNKICSRTLAPGNQFLPVWRDWSESLTVTMSLYMFRILVKWVPWQNKHIFVLMESTSRYVSNPPFICKLNSRHPSLCLTKCIHLCV